MTSKSQLSPGCCAGGGSRPPSPRQLATDLLDQLLRLASLHCSYSHFSPDPVQALEVDLNPHMGGCKSWPLNPEQLRVLCRRWKLISHPQATNPFGGAFINNTAHIKLRTVTMDNSSYMKWQVSPPAATVGWT